MESLTDKVDTKLFNRYELKEDMVMDTASGDQKGTEKRNVASKGDSFYLTDGYYYSEDGSVLIQSTNSSRQIMEFKKDI